MSEQASAQRPQVLATTPIVPPRVVLSVPVGTNPVETVAGPDRLSMYVANRGSNTVGVVNVGTFVNGPVFAGLSSPVGIDISPDNTLVYVANSAVNTVSVIQRSLATIIATIPVGTTPFGLALSPDGLFAYVANQGSNTVSAINTVTRTVIATIPVGTSPMQVAVAPTGLEVYVTNNAANTLSVINTLTNTVVATVTGLTAPIGVEASPDGRVLYVANNGANTVSVIDTASRTITATIPVGTRPWGAAIAPDGRTLYVANNGANTVSVIDTASRTITTTVAVGNQPMGVSVESFGLAAYVANYGSNTVSVILELGQMAPVRGPRTGGTLVQLTGTSLNGATSAKFGTSNATILFNTSNQVLVSTPPGDGLVPVTVTTPSGTSNAKPFTYYRSATAYWAQANAGPTLGRNFLTIDGDQLATAEQVFFGTIPAVPLVVSDQQITVAAPPALAPGAVPVYVITAGGQNTGSLAYTYVNPPTVANLSVNSGSSFGGNVVNITGQYLSTVNQVTFGGIAAQFSIGSDSLIATDVPASPVTGQVPVAVTTAGGTATLTNGYTYT